ncbi:MAG: hypothetical protein FWD32_01380, partial [Firmicutes bacterium]|nr:hypothetical protein [Bacillota bacterium]
MAFSIVKGKSIADVFNNVLDQAKKVSGNLDTATFILVPDRLSLTAEQQMFDGKIGGLFNTNVVSFTKLAHMVSGGNLQVLSKQNSIMLLSQAINDVKENLECFKKAVKNYSFAEKLYNTINQLTSCGINFG